MCGRFLLDPVPQQITDLFDVACPELAPRYNIAPTQPVLIVRVKPGTCDTEAVHVMWGLVPHWAKDPTIGNRMINARAETVAEKPAFRSALKYRRCLIPASGFYEWEKAPTTGKSKQPYHIRLQSGQCFAFAGLWEHWTGPNGEEMDSCCIITTEANEVIGRFHDRMPVIIAPLDFQRWLDPNVQSAAAISDLLKPWPADEVVVTAISTYVNSARNDGPQCVLPL